MKMEQVKCHETSAHKIQKPGNHPKERIQHSEHGERLKSRNGPLLVGFLVCSDLAIFSGLMLRGPAAKRNTKRGKGTIAEVTSRNTAVIAIVPSLCQ